MKNKLFVFLFILTCQVYGQQHNKNTWQIIENIKNPFDIIGLKHNLICQDFIENNRQEDFLKIKEKKHIMPYVINYITENCCKNEKMYCCFDNTPFDPTPSDILLYKGIENFKSYTYEKSEFSAHAKLYAQNILDSKKSYKHTIKIENQILNDVKLNQQEKNKLLTIAAIFRYSLQFWKNLKEQNISYRKINWGDAADADAVGGCLGMLAGPEAAIPMAAAFSLSELISSNFVKRN